VLFYIYFKLRFRNYIFVSNLIFAVFLFLRLISAKEFATFHLVEMNFHSVNTVCLLYSNECMDGEGVGMRAQSFAGGVNKTVPL
jgi:hypothetical protein